MAAIVLLPPASIRQKGVKHREKLRRTTEFAAMDAVDNADI
jgi:hypothetical protein